MATDDTEEELLRSVALQNAKSILLARQRAERELTRRRRRWSGRPDVGQFAPAVLPPAQRRATSLTPKIAELRKRLAKDLVPHGARTLS
jgi:hypothetical protein